MSATNLAAQRIAGWAYSQSGTPFAYFVERDNRGGGTHIPCETWWQALRFAISLADDNDCEFVGGPGYDER